MVQATFPSIANEFSSQVQGRTPASISIILISRIRRTGLALRVFCTPKNEEPEAEFTLEDRSPGANALSIVNSKYTLSDKLWKYLQNYAAKHKAKGNGFGFGLCGPQDQTRTLSARYYKDGSEILIDQPAETLGD